MANRTLYQMFLETVERHGDNPAVGFKAAGKTSRKPTESDTKSGDGATGENDYTYWNYREYNARIRNLAAGLTALGLKRGDRLALISHENRVEWAMTDLASQLLGIITVPIYGTLPAPQVEYYVRDSGARAILVSDAKQRAKVEAFRGATPTLECVISMDGDPEELEKASALAFAEVVKRGEADTETLARLDALESEVKPDDIATFIYTSGTTGDPKGATLTHSNLLQTPDAVMDEPVAKLGPGDVFLSFLPLSHITERVGGHWLPIRAGACIVYSLGLSAFGGELTESVRPTALICVPRLYENMYSKFKDALAKMPEKQRSKAEWGLTVGTEAAKRRSEGKSLPLLLKLKHFVAGKLILPKIRERVTGGKLRYCVSGGAPLDEPTANFFLGIGIQILEGYGLSETNIIAINRPNRQRIGTVGPLLRYVEVNIADDGEILMRGQGRMQNYYNKPEATSESIDGEGWFHTGDIGELSSDGYLKITDRKKDILVLTNGKKVAPQPVEALLKHSEYIGEAVVLGDKQATVSALIVPAFDKLIAWGKEHKLETKDTEAFVAHPDVQKLYRAEIDKQTPNLADFEKIKKFKIVPKPFSIESGEITPSLKVKRKVVAEKYADLIGAMSR